MPKLKKIASYRGLDFFAPESSDSGKKIVPPPKQHDDNKEAALKDMEFGNMEARNKT